MGWRAREIKRRRGGVLCKWAGERGKLREEGKRGQYETNENREGEIAVGILERESSKVGRRSTGRWLKKVGASEEGREREKAWQVAALWAEDKERKDRAREKRGGDLRLPPVWAQTEKSGSGTRGRP
ncbi:hypothetical protein AMTR_s00067p00154820 [Amborella trichopoda]|uniref:Uncharacterized protein n=1 Tax=Amborella trichopoda TaxID=13333 RepID=U5D9H5_AMBTC|nr:hypothetical protein AMTR_s00067p00154820 [Amborella trichopoda]